MEETVAVAWVVVGKEEVVEVVGAMVAVGKEEARGVEAALAAVTVAV